MRVSLILLPVLALSLVLFTGCLTLRPFSEVRQEIPEDRFVRVGDQLVHAEQTGAGAPLVLLHGFGASTYAWRKVAPELAESFRVIAIDLNGFGYTERPAARESYTPEGQVAMVLGVLDALKIERAHFAGHSYGGAMTLRLAAGHPERVRSMVLVDSAAPTYPDDRRSRAASFRPLNTLFLRSFALRERMIRKALERVYYDNSLVTPEVTRAYLERLRIEGMGDAYYGLTAPRPPSPPIDLTKIDVPALVIWGTEDLLISVADGRRVSALLPRSTFVTLEKTGHAPMEERPEEVLRLVLPFLKGQG
jgi:pimeloyl-ACP methyl ester carboxylesterase